MAREVVTKIWCDVCLEEDRDVEGKETPPIIIGTMKPRVMALCATHWEDVYEPIRALLQNLGQVLPEQGNASMSRMPGTSAGSGIFPCPDPSCSKHAKPYKHEQSLRNHSRERHGLPINELREKFRSNGDTLFEDEEPQDGGLVLAEDSPPPAITTAECKEKGCDVVYSWPEHKRPSQALGVHKARAHGIRGKSKVPA